MEWMQGMQEQMGTVEQYIASESIVPPTFTMPELVGQPVPVVR